MGKLGILWKDIPYEAPFSTFQVLLGSKTWAEIDISLNILKADKPNIWTCFYEEKKCVSEFFYKLFISTVNHLNRLMHV